MARARGVVPSFRSADLSPAEFRVLEGFMLAPSLWAFQIVAGTLGLDGAIEATRSRELPPDLVFKLGRVGYSVLSLPSHGDIEALLLAAKMEHLRELDQNECREEQPTKALAGKFGADARGGLRAIRVMRTYVPSLRTAPLPEHAVERPIEEKTT